MRFNYIISPRNIWNLVFTLSIYGPFLLRGREKKVRKYSRHIKWRGLIRDISLDCRSDQCDKPTETIPHTTPPPPLISCPHSPPHSLRQNKRFKITKLMPLAFIKVLIMPLIGLFMLLTISSIIIGLVTLLLHYRFVFWMQPNHFKQNSTRNESVMRIYIACKKLPLGGIINFLPKIYTRDPHKNNSKDVKLLNQTPIKLINTTVF